MSTNVIGSHVSCNHTTTTLAEYEQTMASLHIVNYPFKVKD